MQYEHELSPIKPIDDLLDGSELENCMFDVLLGNNDGIGIYISGRQFSCPFCLFVLSVFDTGYSDDYYSNDECAEEANDSDERCVQCEINPPKQIRLGFQVSDDFEPRNG